MTSILEVEQLDTLSSNASSTITIGGTNATTLNLGSNITGGSMTNTPAFIATNDTATSMSGDTWTVYTFDAEVVDTDSAFDTSTYKFTVPTGKAGTYLFTVNVSWSTAPDGCLMSVAIAKNGSRFVIQQEDLGSTQSIDQSVTGIINCSVGDEIQAYLRHEHSGNTENTGTGQRFSGFRLIGA